MSTNNFQKKMNDTTTFRLDDESRQNLLYLKETGLNASKVFRKVLADFVEKHREAGTNK